MSNIAIVTDSTAYLPEDLLQKYNIHVIPQVLIWGEKTYEDGVDTLLAIGEAVSSLKVITNSTSNRNLEYNPDGTTNESGGTARFAICDSRGGAYGRQVNVSPIGRPVIAKGSTGAPINCTSPS